MNVFTKSVRSLVGCTILSSVLATFSLPSLAESRAISIRNIRNPKSIEIDNYYCELHLVSDRQKRKIFVSSISPKMNAVMNIDGRDRVLRLVREVKTKGGSIATYRAGDINVKVNYALTRQGNEEADYNATLSVSRGKRSKTISTTGYCGIS